jgi:hypothetical protein
MDEDVVVPVRDGIHLLADVHRPAEPGRYPVLIAASPYPRQVQNLGAPMGFIEAGASDFFVPRGYVHVIANLRGTGGSGGTFGFFDEQERQDMHDLVEWAAAQSWSDGNVGMVGISYFAMTQLEAAVEQPPHLKAIMPVAVTSDLYEASSHHGLVSAGFLTPFVSMVGMTSVKSNKLWRSKLLEAVSEVILTPGIHKRFDRMNGEAAMTGIKLLLKLHHPAHPWDDLWRSMAVEHPTRDAWWNDRNLRPLLHKVKVPVYLGCDWDNVPLHLPSTLDTINDLRNSPHVQVAMLGEHGLSWPWESLHVEALAWFDHWLKGQDTGILEGPKFRYVLPGAEGWHAAESWPIPGTRYREFALGADGGLSEAEGAAGSRSMMTISAGQNPPPQAHETNPPSSLEWTTEAFTADMDMVGPIELRLDASITAADAGWIVLLQEIDDQGAVSEITGGYLRATLRAVDEAASSEGAPVLPCTTATAVPIGEMVRYRIPLVPNARRLKAGHKLRVYITGDDQDPATPAIMSFRHASVGTSSLRKIASSSRLLIPVVK